MTCRRRGRGGAAGGGRASRQSASGRRRRSTGRGVVSARRRAAPTRGAGGAAAGRLGEGQAPRRIPVEGGGGDPTGRRGVVSARRRAARRRRGGAPAASLRRGRGAVESPRLARRTRAISIVIGLPPAASIGAILGVAAGSQRPAGGLVDGGRWRAVLGRRGRDLRLKRLSALGRN